MTLILAGIAKDGVVVVGDDKMISPTGKPPRFIPKVFELHDGTLVGMARTVDNGRTLLQNTNLFKTGPVGPAAIASFLHCFIGAHPPNSFGPIDFIFAKPGSNLVLMESVGSLVNYRTQAPVVYSDRDTVAYIGSGISVHTAHTFLAGFEVTDHSAAEVKDFFVSIVQKVAVTNSGVGHNCHSLIGKAKHDHP